MPNPGVGEPGSALRADFPEPKLATEHDMYIEKTYTGATSGIVGMVLGYYVGKRDRVSIAPKGS